MKEKIIVRPLQKNEKPPMDLLLMADPSEKLVLEYLKDGICRVGEIDGKVIAVYVLIKEREGVAELINVAVDESLQGYGLGKFMVLHAVNEAKAQGFKEIEVGTGNSSLMQMALYQKCGFRMDSVRKNFFIDNYDEEIFENGMQCMDMIRLVIKF